MTIQSENVGAAFGLVVAAGASTALGSAVVFFPTLVKLANRKVLAASLGFSAGVMIYASFSEVISKALKSFEEGGIDQDRSYVCASLCFFSGIVVVMVSLFGFVGRIHRGASFWITHGTPLVLMMYSMI